MTADLASFVQRFCQESSIEGCGVQDRPRFQGKKQDIVLLCSCYFILVYFLLFAFVCICYFKIYFLFFALYLFYQVSSGLSDFCLWNPFDIPKERVKKQIYQTSPNGKLWYQCRCRHKRVNARGVASTSPWIERFGLQYNISYTSYTSYIHHITHIETYWNIL